MLVLVLVQSHCSPHTRWGNLIFPTGMSLFPIPYLSPLSSQAPKGPNCSPPVSFIKKMSSEYLFFASMLINHYLEPMTQRLLSLLYHIPFIKRLSQCSTISAWNWKYYLCFYKSMTQRIFTKFTFSQARSQRWG